VSDEETEAEYVMFNHAGVNTLDPRMRARQKNAPHGAFQEKGVVKVITRRLDRILDDLLPAGREIDLLSVDVEGWDLKVLHSNNWERYRPFVVMVETHGMNLGNVAANPVYSFLGEQGYTLVSHCFATSIFIRE
jgi:FkbM family methyltransferase